MVMWTESRHERKCCQELCLGGNLASARKAFTMTKKHTFSEFLKLCQKRCKEVILRYKGAVLCTCVLNAEIKSRLRDVRRSPLPSS